MNGGPKSAVFSPFFAHTYTGQGITCFTERDVLVGCQEHMQMSQLALKWPMASIAFTLHGRVAQLQSILSTYPAIFTEFEIIIILLSLLGLVAYTQHITACKTRVILPFSYFFVSFCQLQP